MIFSRIRDVIEGIVLFLVVWYDAAAVESRPEVAGQKRVQVSGNTLPGT
jgi:hypothetical protein